VDPDQISLEGNAVAIAAGHLTHRLYPLLLQQHRRRPGRHSHDRSAAVGHIHGMDSALQPLPHGQHVLWIASLRRHHFRCDQKLASFGRCAQLIT
jgi:hypothetical protein